MTLLNCWGHHVMVFVVALSLLLTLQMEINLIKHNYLSRNLVFILYISTASRSLLQQTEVTDVSHDQCHVTQAGVGLVGAPGQRLSSA